MTRVRETTTAMILAGVLVVGFSPVRIHASGIDEQIPIRLRAESFAGPVGVLRTLGTVRINGRSAYGETLLFGGETIQVPTGVTAQAMFESAGRAVLAGGSIARFRVTEPPGIEGNLLIASLTCGSVSFDLVPSVHAYVRTGVSAVSASAGAKFRISLRGGTPSVETSRGEVVIESAAHQQTYNVRPVGVGASVSVRARSTRQIQVQVTDENDNPVPDLPVLFTLGTPGSGSLGTGPGAGPTFTANTNSQGIASASFTAADAGATSITATVVGTQASWTGQIVVAAAAGFWTPTNTALVLGAAAAGTGLGVYLGTRGSDDDPIRPIPPPEIRPQ